MNYKSLNLATYITVAVLSNAAVADGMPIPPEAIAPIEPQSRPEPQPAATGIVVEYTTPTNDVQATGGEKLNEKTRNEIYAMLADEVKNVDNVVVIEHSALNSNAKPAVESSALSVADQPNGHFRVFAEVSPVLEKNKAVLKLQLLRAGHSGDANDMVKPLTETTVLIDPKNVRASQEQIHKFLASKLNMSNGQAQEAMSRPKVSMWIEVKNDDGSEGVKDGSKLIVYYKPDSNVYMNLYYINSENNIKRLIPSKWAKDNFSQAGHIYRFPPTGDGFMVTGTGIDKIRAIYTRIPSGVGMDLGLGENAPKAKQMPIGVIPTQYPAIFATQDLQNFFSMPEQGWNEYEISYEIKK